MLVSGDKVRIHSGILEDEVGVISSVTAITADVVIDNMRITIPLTEVEKVEEETTYSSTVNKILTNTESLVKMISLLMVEGSLDILDAEELIEYVKTVEDIVKNEVC